MKKNLEKWFTYLNEKLENQGKKGDWKKDCRQIYPRQTDRCWEPSKIYPRQMLGAFTSEPTCRKEKPWKRNYRSTVNSPQRGWAQTGRLGQNAGRRGQTGQDQKPQTELLTFQVSPSTHRLSLPEVRIKRLSEASQRKTERFRQGIKLGILIYYSLVAQSCLTLCKPMDCSPPGSPVRGKTTKMGGQSLPFDSGIEPASPALLLDSSPLSQQGSPRDINATSQNSKNIKVRSSYGPNCVPWPKVMCWSP